MSYHGKLQVLKNGTADAEIQLWAYQQIETIEYLYKRHDEQQAEIEALKNRNWDLVSEPWGFDRKAQET